MDWSRGHIIGHGSSASVYVANLRSTGEILAVKSVELSRSEPLRREHEILSTLDHTNIIRYVGCHVTIENNESVFNLVMEYATEGTVSDAARGGRLDEPTTSHCARGITKGLEYLHSRGIVHCDIKGSNVLLSRGEAKIADFGCSKAAGQGEGAAIGGTPMFMSPETARGEEQGFPADIWALGCTIIEMATGNSPWPNSATTLGRIAFAGETPEVPGFLSDSCKDFLSKCLRVDPGERWTAGQLLEHPFIEEIKSSTCSPTSVLDRGIWSSVDQEEVSEDAVSVSEMGYGDCAMERMKDLTMGSGDQDKWEWGERWIKVRDSKTRFREQRDITEELVLDELQFL